MLIKQNNYAYCFKLVFFWFWKFTQLELHKRCLLLSTKEALKKQRSIWSFEKNKQIQRLDFTRAGERWQINSNEKKERKGLEIASLLPVLCCCHANGFHTNLISDYDSALSCIVLFVLLSQLKVINNRLLCFWVILYWLVFFC